MQAEHHGARRTGQHGASFVELIISVVIALMALTSIVRLTVDSSRMRRDDEELNLAAAACAAKLEELRSMTLAELQQQDGRGFDVAGRMGEVAALQARERDPDGFPMLVKVVPFETSDRDHLYRVDVLVEWWGVGGARSFSLTALITDRRG